MERVVIYTPAQDFFYNTTAGAAICVIFVLLVLTALAAAGTLHLLKLDNSRHSGVIFAFFAVVYLTVFYVGFRYFYLL